MNKPTFDEMYNDALTPETCSGQGYEWTGDTLFDEEAPTDAMADIYDLISQGWKLGRAATPSLAQNTGYGLYKPLTN